ncbi:hypothetical protein [Neokomagataea thailandica]|uniref:Phage protein D n=1 Tax=Neokomagataea tanensis NBRC 106556 TaxID=1223519 RepID=A0ABQ0QGT9_9PROT|nr:MULTISPECIES: hypothetical protein [Neokomagataea]GBR44225.1 hypothetical protein AA106556_0355 [Neokomagataea tanensis NBRC 106556]
MIRQFECRILWNDKLDKNLLISEFEIDSSRYESSDVAVVSCILKVGQGTEWYQSQCVHSPWLTLQMRDVNASVVWNTVFEGRVDCIRRAHGQSKIEFECRDAMAALIDLRLQNEWINHNGSDLLYAVAQKANLEIDIEFPSTISDGMCGQFWQVEHKRNILLSQHRFQTAADIVFDIARDMSCDLYAAGQKIMCRPIRAVPQKDDEIFDLRNCLYEGTLSSDLALNKGITVCFSSWDSRQRIGTTVYYDGVSFSKNEINNNKIYSFRVPGKRLEDLKRLAKSKYNRLMSHAVSSEISVPGMFGLAPRKFVALLWEGKVSYFSVDRVVSHFSHQHGFLQNVTIKKRVV